jgi:hypothetical protein
MRLLVSLALASGCIFYGAGALAEPSHCDQQSLRDEARRARTWRYSWSGVNAGFTVGSFVAVPLVDKESRPDWIVSGVGSGVTLLVTWFFPLRVESAADELDALPADQRARQFQRLRLESADDEHARVTWPWHVLNFGLSAGAGSIIAFGYHHYASGAVTTVVSTALGEAQILTQPTNLPKSCPQGLQLVPRLAFTPRVDRAPSTWTLSLAGAF